MFGELHLIRSRVALDILTLLLQCICIISPIDRSFPNAIIAFLITYITAGWSFTNRWTISFPLLPFLVLQGLRFIFKNEDYYWVSLAIAIASSACVFLGLTFSILFTPVTLPPIKGAKYNIGVVDVHLPVLIDGKDDHVTARIFYPTKDDSASSIPYLNPKNAIAFCKESMKIAPPAIRSMDWILHTWRLMKLPVKRNAAPLEKKMPLVVYSHGLGGTREIYTYQTLNVAASGNIVVSLDHADGSAALVERVDGSLMLRDFEIHKLDVEETKVEYARLRRQCTDLRVQEFLGAARVMLRLDKIDIIELQKHGVSFIDKIDTTAKVVFMGHSFGGATALTAAQREPSMASCVIAHEPAVDWSPDDTRRALHPDEKLEDSKHVYTGGLGGYVDDDDNGDEKQEVKKTSTAIDNMENSLQSAFNQSDDKVPSSSSKNHDPKSVHDLDLLFLYSNEWYDKNWGSSHIMECMHKRGELGLKGGVSDFGVISNAHHPEFSDINMLLPTWMSRAIGLAGSRNPVDSAQEIGARTLAFINAVRKQT